MRTSFILYTDMCALICKLRDAEAGRVFKAIFHYASDGEVPANLRGASEVCFEIVRKSLDRDWERYDEVRRRRAEAGRAGGIRTRELYQQKEANAGFAGANAADNENENVNGNVNENGSENENVPVPGPPAAGADSAPTPILYGKYRNLAFTPEEYEALRTEFPEDFEARLERLSEYTASSGKKYASALATIRAWARKEAQDGNLEGNHDEWSLGNVL